jgi:hypothetical protein
MQAFPQALGADLLEQVLDEVAVETRDHDGEREVRCVFRRERGPEADYVGLRAGRYRAVGYRAWVQCEYSMSTV